MNPESSSDQSNGGMSVPSASQISLPPLPSAYAPQTTADTASPLPPISAVPPTLGAVPSSTVAVNNDTTYSVTSSTTSDTDLIEKEWVEKAKQIVRSNLENPYEQSKELTALKADYMKQRYNKDIRQSK
jgi:hypothetical protein